MSASLRPAPLPISRPIRVLQRQLAFEDLAFANGYIIEEAGKPPDLVLEVASRTTARRDYIGKRETYADLEVPEYWRFDYTGGNYHDAPLACDLLVDGSYQPMALTTEPDGVVWGYSEVLGLSVCWVQGRLRFWDRQQQRYLPNLTELAVELAESQARAETARGPRPRAGRGAAPPRQRLVSAGGRRHDICRLPKP